MPVFKVGDKVKSFNNQKGVITEIKSMYRPEIHPLQNVEMVYVQIGEKVKEFFYRDLKHDN